MRSRTIAQPHLEYRPSGFHWRRRLPRSRSGAGETTGAQKSSLVFPLRTQLFPQAKTLALRLTLLSDIAFAAWTEKTLPIAPVIMEQLLVELCRFLIEAADLAREVAPSRTAEAAAYEQACAMAAMDTLRQAIHLRDREAARAPLREVAARLGVALDETDPDWQRLAMRALRAMLEAGEENLRRDQGQFATGSLVFRSGRELVDGSPQATPTATAPAAALRAPYLSPPVSVPTAPPCPAPVLPPADPQGARPVNATEPSIADPVPAAPPPVEPMVAPLQGKPRSSGRSKSGSMLLADAFDLYGEKKCAGYTDDFDAIEVPSVEAGKDWKRNNWNNLQVAKRIWVELLGNRPIAEIPDKDIKNAKEILVRLPETHGKSCNQTRDLRRLVKEIDDREKKAIAQAAAEAALSGGSPAKIEKARLDARIPRLRVETILKHVRALNKPAKMLVKMGKLESSPFSRHMISNQSAAAMHKAEETRDRRPWDDRIYKFLATPAFRGRADGFGDPLFWTPLMALLGGAREEEILQLSPDDFETSEGIHYYRIRRGQGQSVKSDAGDRLIPVHPELIRLGLLRLVELRRKEGEPRLFPYLQRGKHKETFTELFTKEFTAYRKKHHVYWRGLDFHALRTTLHHKLMENLVPGYVKRRLMGHEGLDEGERSYSQGGISIRTLHEVICAVAFDLSRVQSPFGEVMAPEVKTGLRLVQ